MPLLKLRGTLLTMEVSNQMLELYEQNRTAQPSHGSEIEGSVGGGANHRNADKNPTIEEQAPPNGHSHGPGQSEIPRISQEEGGDRGVNLGNYASQSGPPRTMINQSNDYGSKDHRHHDQDHFSGARDPENMMEALSKSKPGAEDPGDGVAPKGYRPPDVIRKIDKDKVKAALEKRRKSRGDVTKKTDLMDDDDLIERELESGVELAAQERRQGWSNKPLHKPERDNKKRSRSLESEELGELGDAPAGVDENSEEGELSFDALETCSPRSGGGTWSERGGGSPNRPVYGKNQYQHHHHEPLKPVTGKGRDDHTERDLKRHRQ